MPELSEIVYSEDACVAAVRDYYNFLTKLYLKESDLIEPPKGGWPSITTDNLRSLGKSDKVVSLLRRLPYIRLPNDDRDKAQGSPWTYFADWQRDAHDLSRGLSSGEDLRASSEEYEYLDDIPPQVIGLTSGGRDNQRFLLDTELGIVHWPGCDGEIRNDPSREGVDDDPYDYAPENEAEWRAEAPAWPIADFFELLKDQYRELKFVPLSSRIVQDVYARLAHGTEGMIPMLQSIYREHGWPDLARYNKGECLEAVHKALEERYPGDADRRDDE